MTAAEVLTLAKARGVTIRLDGAELELTADRKPDSDLLDAIAGCKADISAFLHPDAVRRRLEAEAEVLRAPRPPDVADAHWAVALRGLRAFLAAGHGAEAERLGWPKDELYGVPPVWARVDLCGAGLLIGDNEVTEVTASRIGIRTASGSTLGFYRKPQVDYGAVYRERLRMAGEDRFKEEVQLRAVEHTVNVCCANTGLDLEAAKKIVLAAIGRIPTKETASA